MMYAIVILAVMNISTLATIIYHQVNSDKQSAVQVKTEKQTETDAEKFSGRYFRDKLNLSDDQMNKFRGFNQEFRSRARNISIEMVAIRKQMLEEMASGKADTSKLNDLSDSIGLLHSELKKITYRYYLEIQNICDAEQNEKLEQLFSEMFINDTSISFPGKGGKGWQHGRK
jgi:Spy/CpxP family protein refolding chaperone